MKILLGITKSNLGGALLGNPRFSQSFLHGETAVSPTPFWCPAKIKK